MHNPRPMLPYPSLVRRALRLLPAALLLATALAGSALGAQQPLGRWTPIGPAGETARALVAANGVVYAATAESGLLVSKDGGRHWRTANSGLDVDLGGLVGLAIDPKLPNVLYAVSDGALYRTSDGAATWQQLPIPNAGTVTQIVVAPSRPRTLYATNCFSGNPGGCGILRSDDRGASWTGTSLGQTELGQLVVDPSDPDTLYLADERIAKSTDGGASWTTVGPARLQFVGSLAIDPTAPRTIYAAGFGRVGKSTDGGRTWPISRHGLPQAIGGSFLDPQLETLIVDPLHPSTLFTIGGSSHGLGIGAFVSTDAGITWKNASRGLPRADLNGVLAFDSSTGTLYAATFGLGLYAFLPTPGGPLEP